jgi:F-type H+-transporting ATPase subunit delta
MGSDPLVKAYAEALLQIARAEERLDRVEEEMALVGKAIDTNAELKEFLNDPGLAPAGKQAALAEIFGKSLSPMTMHWLHMVVDEGRQRRLPAIIEAFSGLAQEAREMVTAEVVTAVPLSEEMAGRLARELSKSTRKRVHLQPVVDESILGGVVIRIGGKVIDGSIRHRLEEIKLEMVRGA